ncbi:hypothetical protein ACP275_09G102300 [Erythranthe tilingii]
MGYKEVQSYRSIFSKKNTLNQTNGAHGAGDSIKPTEFVNNGLLLWNQGRQKWVGNKKAASRVQQLYVPKCRSLRLCLAKKFMLCCWNMTNDSLLKSKKPFPRPIRLEEMVDFLVDIWEQEGMYD